MCVWVGQAFCVGVCVLLYLCLCVRKFVYDAIYLFLFFILFCAIFILVQAYEMRPSIIFFDEIDGLAPVRSSQQDQIHNSIVSTLLALMDGLDSRGEVVVIGATNRIDAIDPAFRRPGRFDREFRFPFPNLEVRIYTTPAKDFVFPCFKKKF